MRENREIEPRISERFREMSLPAAFHETAEPDWPVKKRSVFRIFLRATEYFSIFAVLLTYVGFPLAVYFRVDETKFEVRPVGEDDPEIPYDVQGYAKRVADDLETLGFEHIEDFLSPIETTSSHLSIFYHRVNNDAALLTLMENPMKSDPLSRRRYQIDFSRHLEPDIEINVSNTKLPLFYHEYEGWYRFAYEDLQDPAELYRLHQMICAEIAPASKIVVAPLDDPLSLLREDYEEASRRLIEQGLMKESKNGEGRYALTLKSAFLMTYKVLWPVNKLFAEPDYSHNDDMLDRLRVPIEQGRLVPAEKAPSSDGLEHS
jgi:hypothetical protein